MLRRSAAKRYVELGKPSERFGTAALVAGWLSFVPLAAPFTATFAAGVSLLGTLLAGRFPERYAGGRRMTYGLLLSVVGVGLFMVEAPLFWRWKTEQAYDQRIAVTKYRMSLVAGALERYRQDKGAYPEVSGVQVTKRLLEPAYAPFLPTLDGFEGSLSVASRPEGFTITAFPPPRPRTDWTPRPLLVEGGFQPAPSPPPPPPVEPPPEGSAPPADQPPGEEVAEPGAATPGQEAPSPPQAP